MCICSSRTLYFILPSLAPLVKHKFVFFMSVSHFHCKFKLSFDVISSASVFWQDSTCFVQNPHRLCLSAGWRISLCWDPPYVLFWCSTQEWVPSGGCSAGRWLGPQLPCDSLFSTLSIPLHCWLRSRCDGRLLLPAHLMTSLMTCRCALVLYLVLKLPCSPV